MHGLGNDFMVVDCTERDLQLRPKLIRKLSDRNFGVGFDQLLLVEKASTSEVDFTIESLIQMEQKLNTAATELAASQHSFAIKDYQVMI